MYKFSIDPVPGMIIRTFKQTWWSITVWVESAIFSSSWMRKPRHRDNVPGLSGYSSAPTWPPKLCIVCPAFPACPLLPVGGAGGSLEGRTRRWHLVLLVPLLFLSALPSQGHSVAADCSFQLFSQHSQNQLHQPSQGASNTRQAPGSDAPAPALLSVSSELRGASPAWQCPCPRKSLR